MNVVGTINFDNMKLDVYKSLDEPLFLATDIADMLGYRNREITAMTRCCEADEIQILPVLEYRQLCKKMFVTENGLYDILSQSKRLTARKWRKIIINKLIELRKSQNKNIVEQFDEWNHELDNLYWDEETGMLMYSVTTQGGDVEQVPYKAD